MKLPVLIVGTAILLGLAAAAATGGNGNGPTAPLRFGDDFEHGLCTGACPGARWAIRQEQDGTVAVVSATGRPGHMLRAMAAAKNMNVTKADLVARTQPMTQGTLLTVAFDLHVPAGTPLNSIQLLDVECATCGEGGNPGIRLYLRRGRLRIDRSKIGIAHAWTRDDAPVVTPDRWHRITLAVRIADDDSGTARVTLDGTEVLAARGATVLPGGHADRVQIGVTANSNGVPVVLDIDDVQVAIRLPG